jgi:hypothetical protein
MTKEEMEQALANLSGQTQAVEAELERKRVFEDCGKRFTANRVKRFEIYQDQVIEGERAKLQAEVDGVNSMIETVLEMTPKQAVAAAWFVSQALKALGLADAALGKKGQVRVSPLH